MFDIGFLELLIIAVVALVVLGPERLPTAIRVTALWIGRIRQSFQNIKSDIERELDVDDIRRQIHNESVMNDLKKSQKELEQAATGFQESLNKQRQALEKDVVGESSASADSSSDQAAAPSSSADVSGQTKKD